MMTSKKLSYFFINYYLSILLMVLFAWIIMGLAWMSDDALISLKQVWNAVHGQGYTFNFNERVQAFTHPTWVLLLTIIIFFTKDIFYTTMVISIILSLSALLLIIKHHYRINKRKNIYILLFSLLFLSLSQAFTDYTTSGLENPLSYFLLGLIIYLTNKTNKLHKNQVMLIFILLALLFLNRFDYAILVLPLSLYIFFFKSQPKQSFKALLPALAIILTWFIFAIIYFGAPFPNTFYAKLMAGYPSHQIYERGFNYYHATFSTDFITLFIIGMGILAGFFSKKKIYISLSVGMLLYNAYIINIGGDFMLGRYFAISAYLSMFNMIGFLSYIKIKNTYTKYLIIVLSLLFVIFSFSSHIPALNIFDIYDKRKIRGGGVFDERIYYIERNLGLWGATEKWLTSPFSPALRKPNQLYTLCGGIGRSSISNPQVYFVDKCGLTDAFLSRIPALPEKNWRIGHHFRGLPIGYIQYISNNKHLFSKNLQYLLDDVKQAISGSLFSKKRWEAIWRLNITKPYQVQPFEETINVPFSLINQKPHPIQRYSRTITLTFNGILSIKMDKPIQANKLAFSVLNNSSYEIVINGQKLTEVERYKKNGRIDMLSYSLQFNTPIIVKDMEIRPSNKDYYHAIGFIQFK